MEIKMKKDDIIILKAKNDDIIIHCNDDGDIWVYASDEQIKSKGKILGDEKI